MVDLATIIWSVEINNSYLQNRNRVIGSVENCSSFSPSSCPSFLTMKQEFTDEESKRQYMKERQKKDNHNLSKFIDS